MSVDDLNPDICQVDETASRVKDKILGVGDLKDPPLSVIPEKDLNVAVGVSRIFGRKVAARLKHNKTAISADRPGE